MGERVIIVERRLQLTERTCAVCGRTFEGWGRARFCSRTCQNRWDYGQHAEQRRAERRERYWRQRDQQQAAGAAKEGRQR